MLSLLITVLILCGMVASLWWASGSLALPEPVRIVVVTGLAVVALALLWSLLPAPGPRWRGLGP